MSKLVFYVVVIYLLTVNVFDQLELERGEAELSAKREEEEEHKRLEEEQLARHKQVGGFIRLLPAEIRQS